MKGNPLAVGLVVLAVVFAILAALYGLGMIDFFTTASGTRHYKHAIVLAGLTVVSLVAANFARQKAPA